MKIIKRLLLLLCLTPGTVFAQNYPQTHCVSASPTADTSAYVSGETVGGKLTFSNALRDTRGTGYIISAALVDQSAQAQDMELVIFNQNPSSTTFTDQAALDIADADVSKIAAPILFGSSNRFAYADNGFKYAGSLSLPVEATDSSGLPSSTLYGVIVTRGTPTFAASTDLKAIICISGD